MIAHAGAWKTNMAIHPKDGLTRIFHRGLRFRILGAVDALDR
jgi:hypothetical protein